VGGDGGRILAVGAFFNRRCDAASSQRVLGAPDPPSHVSKRDAAPALHDCPGSAEKVTAPARLLDDTGQPIAPLSALDMLRTVSQVARTDSERTPCEDPWLILASRRSMRRRRRSTSRWGSRQGRTVRPLGHGLRLAP